jgi:rubrerythrin
MDDLRLFLSHAVALEGDAAERYHELTEALDVHNNAEVADLFRRMEHFSNLHLAEARDRAEAAGGVIRIKPWEFEWADEEAPESAAVDAAHYMMTPHHALKLALSAEKNAFHFYDDVRAVTTNPDVRALAAEFAEEEADHARELEQWLEHYPPPEDDWADDPDPPVSVD